MMNRIRAGRAFIPVDPDRSQFDVLRDCYDGPARHADISTPPIHNPNHFQQQLDDQYQSGWTDGYCTSEDHRPIKYWSIGLLGTITGFLLYHVLTIIL